MSGHDANTPEEFNALLQKADKSLVDFHATWCGPCKRIAPYLSAKCGEHGVNLIKVDVDVNGAIAQKYGIQSMPTFKVIDKAGNVLLEKVGGSEGVVDACIAAAK